MDKQLQNSSETQQNTYGPNINKPNSFNALQDGNRNQLQSRPNHTQGLNSHQKPMLDGQSQLLRPQMTGVQNQIYSQNNRPQPLQNIQQVQQQNLLANQSLGVRPFGQINPNLTQRPINQSNPQLQNRASSQQNLQQTQANQQQSQLRLSQSHQQLNNSLQRPPNLNRTSVTSQGSQVSQNSNLTDGIQQSLRSQPISENQIRPQLKQQLQGLSLDQQSPQQQQRPLAFQNKQFNQQKLDQPVQKQSIASQLQRPQQFQNPPGAQIQSRPLNNNLSQVRPQLQGGLRPLGQLPIRGQPLKNQLQTQTQPQLQPQSNQHNITYNNQLQRPLDLSTQLQQQQQQGLQPMQYQQQTIPSQQQIAQQQQNQQQPYQGQIYPQGRPSMQNNQLQQQQNINDAQHKPDFMKQQSMDYTSYQQQKQNQQSRTAGGMDPSQIPRPDYDDTLQVYYTSNFATSPRKGKRQPPPASSHYAMIDDGSCSVAYIRASTHVFPQSRDVSKTTNIPLCVIVTPLAKVNEQESDVPVIDFGEVGPMRCSMQGCKGYMNPFNQFIEHGRKWVCVFCNHVNETPQDQVCDIDAQGIRRDAHSRPDFSCGSVEYVAYEEYQQRPPMLPDHFFLIENTKQAQQMGLTQTCLIAISENLKFSQSQEIEGMPSQRSRVGLGLYDENSISFYSFINEIPQQIVVGDVDDVFAPPVDLVLQPLEHIRDHMILFCQSKAVQIQQSNENNFEQVKVGTQFKQESCTGAAIGAAIEALQTNGGKVHVYLQSRPNRGQFQLQNEDQNEGTKYLSMTNGERDKYKHTLLIPSQEYISLSKFAAEQQICVDLAIFGQQEYINVASVSKLVTVTGGSIYPYRNFKQHLDFNQVYEDLHNNLSREQGLEAVMRLRCNQALSVKNYHGSFYRRTSSDIDFPAIDSTKSLMVELKSDSKMQEDERVYLQAALLYSSPSGERRIRIHTQQLPVSPAISTVFLGTDQEVLVNYLARISSQKLAEGKTLEEAREFQYNSTVNLLLAYRKHCSSESRAGQLVLPESLKNLPSFILGLMKSDAFKNCYSSFDDRALFIASLQGLLLQNFIGLTYPRLFDLQNLDKVDNKNFKSQIPISSEPLRSDTLFSTGVYLLENGQDIYIYADKHVNEEFLQRLFGFQNIIEFEENLDNLQWFGKSLEQNGHTNGTPQIDFELYEKVLKLFTLIRQRRQNYMKIRLLKRSDPQVQKFFELLLEDKSKPGPAIIEFLTNLHRSITQMSE